MNPFAQLLGHMPRRMPKTGNATVVVAGKAIKDVRQIDRVLKLKEDAVEAAGDDADDLAAAEAARLRQAVRRAKDRAKYQREKADPARMAKRKEWLERNRERVREWKREYDARTYEQQRAVKTEWARKRRAESEEFRAKQAARTREYYQRNREKILAKKKAQAEAARAAKAAGSAA